MIPVPAGVRVWLATGHTDMRNYAQPTVMLSPQRDVAARRGFLAGLTPHILGCARPCSAWP
jgi:hypothetical protein